jgi:hypothetical protein
MLVIPPPLVECLQCFDGSQTDLDLRAALVSITGDLQVGQLAQHLAETLSAAGFLEDAQYAEIQQERKREFAEATVREPSHAGSAYPADTDEMRQTMGQWMEGAETVAKANGGLFKGDLRDGDLFAIAAPHVSPQGGWQNYGEPETFGLTRKTFRTPLGDAPTDAALVDRLAARGGKGVAMEDYCHRFEHTVELQVIFLQHVLGPGVKILPILVGPFARSIYQGGDPEDDDRVKAFFEALGELREREGDRLFWVMGVDMAHMGARYHDGFAAVAGEGAMQEVGARDERRIERINALDAGGFWDLVRQRQDDLKWCGSSPFYTFLKTAPKARGELLKYEQWNIDDNSVVSFAGMGFRKA